MTNTALISQTINLSGFVEDAKTGERLIYANIFEQKLQIGTTTNNYGYFNLVLPNSQKTFNISISYIGYETKNLSFNTLQDTLILIELSSKSYITDEVTVEAEAVDINLKNTQMSTINIPIKQIQIIPAFLGEIDVLKVLQLLPGIQSGNEGSSGLYVRGGTPDQNLILLDGTTVYNASHLFGFFSVFNADAVKNVNIIKGGFPARFGGRLSSILEINMKEGNKKEFEGSASIGLISSKLTLEGPIISDKTSFIISGRRTYIDALSRPFMDDSDYGGYFFYDFNLKLNHIFSLKDRLFFSLYLGDDKFYAASEYDDFYYNSSDKFDLGWGNITSVIRWNHIFSNNLFSNISANYSQFEFLTNVENSSKYAGVNEEFYKAEYVSGIKDFSAAIDFDYTPNQKNYIKFGGKLVYHKFNPGIFQYKASDGINKTITSSTKYQSFELRSYFENDIDFTQNLKANLGFNSSLFIVDNKSYNSIEPRISLRYLINDWSVKASYTFMNQYIHLLSNSGIGLPTDLWVPTTDFVKPEKSEQAAIGLSTLMFNNEYKLNIESYYKTMKNLLEYKEGAEFFNLTSDWQDKITFGNGTSYGVEFLVKKTSGNTTGWIGYTLSWTNREFKELNYGNEFPFKYDRRHDLSLVLTHKFSEYYDASLTWVYGTGNAITLPIS